MTTVWLAGFPFYLKTPATAVRSPRDAGCGGLAPAGAASFPAPVGPDSPPRVGKRSKR
jgi:hypothetical protein